MFKKKLVQWFLSTMSMNNAEAPSPYVECIARWRALTPPTVSVYRSIRSVEFAFPTIEVYIEELVKLERALRENRLYTYPEIYHVSKVTISAFYLSREECFLDVSAVHDRFVDLIIRVLELYDKAEDDLDRSVITNQTLFRSLPVINNVMQLSEALTELA